MPPHTDHDSTTSSPVRGFDRTIHEPARLAILTILQGTPKADFVFLRRLLGLTGGNLSSHLSKLEAAGLISLRKSQKGIGPRTFVTLTDAGRTAVRAHWSLLDRLRGMSSSDDDGSAPEGTEP